MQNSFSRNQTAGTDLTACRTALCLVVMLATPETIEACENTLVYLAETEDYGPSAETFKRSLDELRILAQLADEEEE
jgi:hypothetical protein